MSEIELFIGELLNFGTDWEVREIKVDHALMSVDIYLDYVPADGIFPGTDKRVKVYDFGDLRRVRHLDIFDFQTYVNFRTPRVKNEEKTEIRNVEIGWVSERVSFSLKFECKVIDTLKMSKNKTQTASYLNTTFDIVDSIQKRAVARGLQRRDLSEGLTALSIDEKSFSNGHNYLTVLSDPTQKRVLDVIEGRKQEDAEELLRSTLSVAVLEKVTLFSMDMWDAFMGAARTSTPNAEIVHDKFHIAKIINTGVDKVRRREVKQEEILKYSKYIFLKNTENLTDNQQGRFAQINQMNLKTSQAWRIKENFNGIYDAYSYMSCKDYFVQWYKDTIEANIPEMIRVADTILRHLKGVINAATYQLSNAGAENINAQIQTVKTVARGFRNFKGYRNSILFFQGKLELYPSP
jgi:transposase